MTEKTPRHKSFEELYRHAEQVVKQEETGRVRRDSKDLLQLLHETEVYQVEMELQNEELRRTSRELADSRDAYFDLFNSAPVGFVVLDGKGRITKANDRAVKLLGEDAAWLKGRLLSRYVYALDTRAFFSWFRRMADHTDVRDSLEVRVLGKAEKMVHVRLDAAAVWDRDDGLKEWRVSLTDITARKQAEAMLIEKESQFQDAFAHAPVGMVIADLQGRYLHVNEAYCRITGYTEQELVRSGLTFQKLTHPDDLEKNLEKLQRLKNGELPALFYEKRYLRKDGTTAWVRSSASLRKNPEGKTEDIIGIIEDISGRKRAEQKLQTLNRKLEQTVAEQTRVARDRAKKLQALVGEVAIAEQKERQRLAKILHDHLQQLLVGARFNSEILWRNADEKQKKTANNVLQLINQSIQTSRSLTAELYPSVLQQGFSAALQWTARWMNENHGLAIDLQADPGNDPDDESITAFLYQSTRELLLNVIKHSGVRSANIETACDETHQQLRVTVSDQGKGFDPVAALKNEGTGFGLFSIQERLELMGGRLCIDSSPGNGAALSLIVPFETKKEIEEESIREINQQIKNGKTDTEKIRLLVVDDHTVVRQGLTTLLSLHADIEMVGEACDGAEAVEKARELEPDVILMDISMPKMDGIQATRIIAAEFPDIRIIGLSMHDSQDQADQMIQAGASAYCMKDGAIDALLSEIRGSG